MADVFLITEKQIIESLQRLKTLLGYNYLDLNATWWL
jgi:hypothetical protein